MDLLPQILSLIPRDESFWSECRAWAPPDVQIVTDPRQLSTHGPPLAILVEPPPAPWLPPAPLGTSAPVSPLTPPSTHTAGNVDEPLNSMGEWGPDLADEQDEPADGLGWLDRLEHPDLPWSWRQWVESEQTQLVVLDPHLTRLGTDRHSLVLPANLSARELALVLTQLAAVGRSRQERLRERQRGERYAKFALRDPLTGLPNRRGWQLFLRRHAGAAGLAPSCCVALVDIDYFKQLNTTFGHATADQVLRRVGRSLRDDLRSGDLAARLGGDEFGIVLSPSPRAAAADVLHRVRRSIRDQLIQARLPVVTVSIGFTEFPISRDDSVRQAVRRAAEALRWAKSHQRNSVVGCDPRWPASSHLA